MPQLLTIKQLSEKLSVPVSTLYQWVNEQKIPVVRLPNGLRFDEKKIQIWVDERTVKSKSIGTV